MIHEKKLLVWIKILAVFGLLLSVYLMWQQLFKPAFQPCSVNSWINCDAVISGPAAYTLGIPTPLYGLIGYIIIFFAALVGKKKLMLGTAAFGLIFCLWIGYIELFQLRVVCPVCIMCQLTMILIFSLSLFVVKHKNNKAA